MALITSEQLKGTGNTNITDNERKALMNESNGGLPLSDIKPVTAYESISYTPTRGMLAPKDFISEDEILIFQFNPTILEDEKLVEYARKSNTGFSSIDFAWSKGGDRTFDFELFFDATASSNTKRFGHSTPYGNPGYDTLNDVYPNGVLDYVENLTKFLYPIQEPNFPRYSSGLAVPNIRFLPPPIAIFVFGRWYLECVVLGVKTKYVSPFDKDLIPRRCICTVRLGVIEVDILKIDERLNKGNATITK